MSLALVMAIAVAPISAVGAYTHATGPHPPTLAGQLYTAFMACFGLTWGVLDVLIGDWPMAVLMTSWGAWGGWCAYRIWKRRRPPRDRKPSRVAGVVRVIKGRLAVVPAHQPS